MSERSCNHLKTILWLSCLGLTVLADPAVAKEPPPTSAPTSAPSGATVHAPMLWRVTAPSGTTSHILGTMHLGVSLEQLPAVVGETFSTSTQLVLEADVRQIDPFEMLNMAQLPEGQTLEAMTGPEVWTQLQEQFGALFPPERMNRMQPWFFELALASMVLPPVPPMDLTLLQQAELGATPITFLESWQDQIEMMNSLPTEIAAEDLLRWFEDRSGVEAELRRLAEIYRTGELAAAEALVFEDLAERPTFYDVTLFNRNAAWMPTIEGLLSAGDAFVAVGLAHLLGERGLLAMLQARGFTVERVTG